MTETVAASAAVSLSKQAEALSIRPGTVCAVAVFRVAHPELAGELDEAIDAGRQASAIARALRTFHGLTLSEHSLARHRRHDCACSHVAR